MAMKNPQDVASKWSRNLSGAGDSIRAGVNAVTVAPTQLAAKQSDAFLNGVQASVMSGKWQRGLQRVTLGDWQAATINKGLPRIAQGAVSGKPKVEAFMTEFLPFVDSAKRGLDAIPRGSLEQNIQRATQFMRQMATFKRTR